jgi:hypothetical protein
MKKITFILITLVFIFNNIKCQKLESIQLSGFTLVKGKIKNFKKDDDQYKIIEISIDDWATSKRRMYTARIDSSGEFSLPFYIYNPQDVLFTYKNKWHAIFVNPNDTLEISLDADNFPEGNQYSGKTARFCSDYLKYKIDNRNVMEDYWSNNSRLQNTFSPNEYKHWRDSISDFQLKSAEDYIQLNNFDNFLSTWIKNDIYLRSKQDILLCYNRQKEVKNIDTAFINSINFEDSTLKFNSSFGGIINSTSVLLSRFADKLFALDNPIKRSIPSSNSQEIKSISGPRYTPEQLQILLFKGFLQSTDVLNNDLFKQSVIAVRYFSILEQQNIDIGFEITLDHIKDYRIRSSAISRYNDYESRHGNLNSLKIANPGSILLEKLIDKFKGYVLLIDFWGTWWGPSYSQMKSMMNIEKKLKNEKIAFIYLCCKCQKDEWGKVIKNFEGNHVFLSLEEYASLANQLNLVSLPRYIIIDKNGKIVNDNAPYPMKQSLVNDLRKYLIN